jgi:hypothetical protein
MKPVERVNLILQGLLNEEIPLPVVRVERFLHYWYSIFNHAGINRAALDINEKARLFLKSLYTNTINIIKYNKIEEELAKQRDTISTAVDQELNLTERSE